MQNQQKNGANQSSSLQHPPALPTPSTPQPSSMTSATGSEETVALAGFPWHGGLPPPEVLTGHRVPCKPDF